MYRQGDLVEVREFTYKLQTQAATNWEESWITGVVVQWLGKTKIRTGIARFETLQVASVLVNGKVRKIAARNLRYPNM